MSNIFTSPSKPTTAQQLAGSLPDGRAWANKNIPDSNIWKLINSVSIPFNQFQQLVQTMDEQFRILQTVDLLEEWEISVGIPDECLMTFDDLEKRRQVVVDRLRKTPIVKLEDIQTFINNLFPDISIVVYRGTEYPFEQSFLDLWSDYLRFIVVVDVPDWSEVPVEYDFEYDFEVPFEPGSTAVIGPDVDKLKCVLDKLLPAEVYILIRSA